MKVTNGGNPYAYQHQRTNTKDKSFANMLANMAADRHGKNMEAEEGGRRTKPSDNGFLNLVNPHRYHGPEIKPTAEQLAVVEAYDSETVKMGRLTAYEAEETRELVASEFKTPPPKYPASIYDLSHDELKSELMCAILACQELETDGLTKGEIYNQIETTFKNYLGNDFKNPNLICCGSVTPGTTWEHGLLQNSALEEFGRQLVAHGISLQDSETVREARGYGGMSDSEIKSAVRAQYQEVMTLKDCITMSHELGRLGFQEEGKAGNIVKDRIMSVMWHFNNPVNPVNPVAQKVYHAMLDMPADFDSIMPEYEKFAKNDFRRYLPQDADEMLDQLMSWIGGFSLYSQEMLQQIRDMLDEFDFDYDSKDAATPTSHYDVFEQMTGPGINNTSADFDSHWEWYWKQFGINAVTQLNPNSKGGQELTGEQISALKEKYDVTNMSKEQEISLLTDLVEMGVLTREQALKSQMAKLKNPSGGMLLSPAGERADIQQLTSSNMIERLTAMIKDEEYLYYRLFKDYGEKHDDLKEFADEHRNILNVIKLLER